MVKRKEIVLKKRIISVSVAILLMATIVGFTGCGSEGGKSTDNTVKAADPMTDEEIQNDDSKGCIEDSDDLLY